MSAALDRLRELAGNNFEQLAGARIGGELPLTDAVVNRAIAERVARSGGPVTGVSVHARDGDALDIELSLQGVPMVSTVPISARVDQQPLLPHSPVLGLTWSLAGLGALARIAGPFIARMRRLPPGIRIEGDRILVDIADLLRAQRLDDLLRHLAHLEVHTHDGRIIVQFELRA